MSIDYDKLRREYRQVLLDEEKMNDDPVLEFESWFDQAVNLELELPNAMVLATVKDGKPAARYVLLKSFGQDGFVFFTHAVSAKGRQLADNPYAALVFYWSPIHRQVRVEGRVVGVSEQEADEYFASRPHGSRVAVWVADQSSEVESRTYLEERMAQLEEEYPGEVPRPETWTGYRVIPESIEFWQGRENRLHDRVLYRRNGEHEWSKSRLAP